MRKFAKPANLLYAGILLLLAAILLFSLLNRRSGGTRIRLQRQPEVSGAGPVTEAQERINLNTADSETLQRLPGIGETRAQAILAYREAHGGFRDLSELLEIPGIGPEVLAMLEDRLYLEENHEDPDH